MLITHELRCRYEHEPEAQRILARAAAAKYELDLATAEYDIYVRKRILPESSGEALGLINPVVVSR